jgi:hypothetical protein
MRSTEREPDEVEELGRRAAAGRDGVRRDHYRTIKLAPDGWEVADIAAAPGRSRRSVQAWEYAYQNSDAATIRPRPDRSTSCRGRGRPNWL